MDYLKKHPMIWFWLSLGFFIYIAATAFLLIYLNVDIGLQKIFGLSTKFVGLAIHGSFLVFSIISLIKNKNGLVKVASGLLAAYYFLTLLKPLSYLGIG